MLRRLSLGLLASAISVASLPAIAQEDGGADDLGVMSISLSLSSSTNRASSNPTQLHPLHPFQAVSAYMLPLLSITLNTINSKLLPLNVI